MRQESDGKHSYALCNASRETSLEPLAGWKCQRYFIERSHQDAKSEWGWDELQAQKYRAWEPPLALTVLASWFIAQTQYEWAREYGRDPAVLLRYRRGELETEGLPALSVAHVRTLLRAVMPLRQMTEAQAAERVIEHLVNRARSRKSRLKKQRLVKRTVAGAT
jgi:hypothetical protein